MDLYQITNKQKTRKWLQALVQKLLGQPHSNIAVDSRIYNSSINFILKGFPVTHLPPVSAKFQAMISSVTSGWVFRCQAWSFIDIPSLAFLYNLHNHFIRILTHMDLPVPQPFAGLVQLLFPFWAQVHHFSTPYFPLALLTSSKSKRPEEVGGRKTTTSSKASSFQARLSCLDMESLSSCSE